jgi:hypothetical protein
VRLTQASALLILHMHSHSIIVKYCSSIPPVFIFTAKDKTNVWNYIWQRHLYCFYKIIGSVYKVEWCFRWNVRM